MNRAPRLRALAILAAVAALATGCTSAADGETGAPSTSPPTASGACPSGDTSATKNPLVVTPAQLCNIDGSTWTVSAFTLVVNTPAWDASTPECDEARKTAFYEGWQPATEAIQTLDLEESPASDDLIGSVGVAVIDTPDAAAAVAALDAEGATCGLGGSQSGLEHGDWRGVRGPSSQGVDDERWSWWIAADGRWAFVQAYATTDATEAQVAELESAITTLLDAQEERL